ncbi:hypothetical protein VK792_08910 [Mesobacterium sp. TK19101]|uniref:Uncharacterized protein n=1 Tax=Mesobacterium hydrothermale TaxID=3111907 RepID=A0ABU6HH21_9RHOB|nr:hypothetical protein [Mesobacterium sp. TK19101]MEC3861402.1 hypothetical protein [Mesobacterium sp. TK19101]
MRCRDGEAKDYAGEIEAAGDLSRRAPELIGIHQIATSDQDFARLCKLVSFARRESGDVEALAASLADELAARLVPVCAGRLDLSAFPVLPTARLFDDPVLSEAFLTLPIASDYLACFDANADTLGNAKHEICRTGC